MCFSFELARVANLLLSNDTTKRSIIRRNSHINLTECEGWMTLINRILFWTDYQSNIKLPCWHPGAEAIWVGHFLVINHPRVLQILKYLLFPERAAEDDNTVLTVWATLFAKFYLCLPWQRHWFWKRTMMKGVLIRSHAAQQCDTHQTGASELNFNKHALHRYTGNCEEWSQWIPWWVVVSVGT